MASRVGNTTKIHALVDAWGNPLKIILTAGQVHDVTIAPALISDFYSSCLYFNLVKMTYSTPPKNYEFRIKIFLDIYSFT